MSIGISYGRVPLSLVDVVYAQCMQLGFFSSGGYNTANFSGIAPDCDSHCEILEIMEEASCCSVAFSV